MKVYDISPTLSSAIGVFPGDLGFARTTSLSFEAGHHLGLSSIATTLHVGAHADAPGHYVASGVGIDRRALGFYLGPCLVVRADVGRGERVELAHFSGESLRALQAAGLPARLLVHTGTFPHPNHWNSDFASFAPEFIRWTYGKGVRLIGLDTPSIDPETSKALESHKTIAELDMAVLEGVCLSGVPVGTYTLIAPPLKIEGADASPLRALLIDGQIVSHGAAGATETELTLVECEPKAKSNQ